MPIDINLINSSTHIINWVFGETFLNTVDGDAPMFNWNFAEQSIYIISIEANGGGSSSESLPDTGWQAPTLK